MADNRGCCAKFQNRMFQFAILIFAVLMYYCLVFEQHMLNINDKTATWQIVYLVFVHLFLLMTIWAYFTTYFMDPGKPPVFWVNHSFFPQDPKPLSNDFFCLNILTINLGILPGRPRTEEETILSDLSYFQT